MEESDPIERKVERLRALTQTGRDTDMGRLLRKFWHPIAPSKKLEIGKAEPIRVLGEDLTLYRGAGGAAHLVGGRCAHRRTVLHTGWVEGEDIRCIYHGWKYDGTGQCIERPAEKDNGPSGIRIAGYPVREYCGLVFAYLGEGRPPSFEAVRKTVFEQPNRLVFQRKEIWPCNWFQHVENSLDAVHVSFVHVAGRIGTFGDIVSTAIPELAYVETESGIRQTATRAKNNVRISNWTFPNNNHINQPGLTPTDPFIDIAGWVVPVDDENTMRIHLWSAPSTTAEADERIIRYFAECDDYSPADFHDELFRNKKYPEDELVPLTSAQDYVAQVGQGTIADRANEWLGISDAGVVLLRKIFWRELEAIRTGRPTKQWRMLDQPIELPIQQKAAPSR